MSQETISELIAYVMERANKCYSDDFPISQIEEWIREFFRTDKRSEGRLITNNNIPEISHTFSKDMLTSNKPFGLTGLKIDHQP